MELDVGDLIERNTTKIMSKNGKVVGKVVVGCRSAISILHRHISAMVLPSQTLTCKGLKEDLEQDHGRTQNYYRIISLAVVLNIY